MEIRWGHAAEIDIGGFTHAARRSPLAQVNINFRSMTPSDRQVEELNQSYRVAEYAPGFLGFGSDGGGEMLAFDAAGTVFMIPFVGMAPKEAQKIAGSWDEIAARITS